MLDSYRRKIDYLRVSITDRCNLRCRYCMPEDLPHIPHQEIMGYQEILRVCSLAAQLGIHRVKVTGGEPFVRKGCIDLLRELKGVLGIHQVTVTTNGVLLERYVEDLATMGIDGVNISLDTLDPGSYQSITGENQFAAVWRSIQKALDAGLQVKLNCVALRDFNGWELGSIGELAAKLPVDVRFIETMPIGCGKEFATVPAEELLAGLQARLGELYPVEQYRSNGPARYFHNPRLQGKIGIIDPVSHSFCHSCNRLRLTSEGFLKSCLCHNDGVDLRDLLRGGAKDSEITQAILYAIQHKPMGHTFGTVPVTAANMSRIGG